MIYKELVKKAIKAKENAYAPYSEFPVGAAILTEKGNIYTGCNIECASYGGTNCAERTAVFKAVSEGERNIRAIAIISNSEDYTYPCGICRQVLIEFGSDIEVIIAKSEDDFKIYTIDKLLPNSFSPEDLKKLRGGCNNGI